ncbi:MAG: 50S ribosomal protein L9 [Candidatus Delongbacteria bacterium]|nr:50S ribosomal protein L9 [Candidatus Delongbacteria bacterium]
MQIILRETVTKLGKQGEIVNVAPGYARNYLIPKGIAMILTEGNKKTWEMEAKSRINKQKKMVKMAEETVNAMQEVSITISMAAGDEDQLYGSVTEAMISEELTSKGFSISKNQIAMADHIKKLGVYDVPVEIDPEHTVTIKVWVVRK